MSRRKSLASSTGLHVVLGPVKLFLWRGKLCTSSKSKIYDTKQYQIFNDWFRWRDEENCTIWMISVLRGRLRMWAKYAVSSVRFLHFFFFVFFTNQATYHNLQRILTYDGSKDLVWRKAVPFVCLNYFRPLLWEWYPLKSTLKSLRSWNPSQVNTF